MGTGIYTTKGGKITELKPKEVKSYIMRVNDWSEAEYNKQRYIIKNKARTLETYKAAHGESVEAQSPVKILYKEARAKEAYGANYKPSIAMERLRSVASYGSKKAAEKAIQGKGGQNIGALYEAGTNRAFSGMISKNPYAAEIASKIKDPVKREKALSDYAMKIHQKRDERGAATDAAIPFGDATGYDSVTINIEDYQ